ncbi:sigma-70 family RNA polymerase sigma factor [Sutcliffiella cohnii]
MSKNEKLVKKAIRGDKEALQFLLREEKEKLYRIAFTYVRNENDAIEVFQQTVLRAIESINQLKEPKYFSTWLVRICINNSIKILRDNKKVTCIESSEINNAASKVEFMEEKIDLLDAIYKLEEKYKTVLILRYYEDLSLDQIAKYLNTPLGTVKTNIRRGLEKLKPILKGVYVDEREGK